MEEKNIEMICENEKEGSKEKVNKSEAKKIISDLLETKLVKRIEIQYKNELTQCECASSKN